MKRGFLISQSDSEPAVRVAVNGTLTIGRTGDCEFVVDDTAASRHHIEIVDRGGMFVWRDLGSTNGTFVNEMRMLEGELHHGDLIRIGTTSIRFEIEEGEEVQAQPAPGTLFRETILDAEGQATSVAEEGDADRLLQAVYSVMNEIATNYEPCSLSDEILKTTIRAMNAQRGAVFFAGGEGGELRGCPVCGNVHVMRDGAVYHTTRSEIPISNTVVHRVLENGESVLYQDSDSQNKEYNAAESIRILNLRSILCVPIRGKNGIMGVLYVDTDRPGQTYTHEHMLLGTAVGNSAGLALENAQMHQQIIEKLRTDQELAYAGIIQAGFLVRQWPEDDPRIQIYGETRPARTVGGDFYDYIRRDDDHVGVLIGDVSGKGVPAALAMAQLLAEFRTQAVRHADPAEVIRALNANVESRSQRGMFCTMCYATLDLTTGEVTVANAGHHPLVHVSGGRIAEVGPATGPPVGILSEGPWEPSTTTLAAGDTIVFYTDGIVEARGSEDRGEDTPAPAEYGLETLQYILSAQGSAGPSEVVQAVMQDVERYCAPGRPHDDCTMVAIRFIG